MASESLKPDIKKRLNRIEGQIRGIQKMVDGGEDCGSILVQVAAVRSAINKVGGIILENYTKSCMKDAAMKGDEKSVDELIDTIISFTRYSEVKD